jgi:hypothetical protein
MAIFGERRLLGGQKRRASAGRIKELRWLALSEIIDPSKLSGAGPCSAPPSSSATPTRAIRRHAIVGEQEADIKKELIGSRRRWRARSSDARWRHRDVAPPKSARYEILEVSFKELQY